MRKFSKVLVLIAGILSFLGINISPILATTPQNTKSIVDVKKNSPLFLHLGSGISQDNSPTWHYSHSSHESHHSHYSHYSSR